MGTFSHPPVTLAELLAVGDEARERVVADFNTGDANVLLGRPREVPWMALVLCAVPRAVSLKAGGVGLNLTAASRVGECRHYSLRL